MGFGGPDDPATPSSLTTMANNLPIFPGAKANTLPSVQVPQQRFINVPEATVRPRMGQQPTMLQTQGALPGQTPGLPQAPNPQGFGQASEVANNRSAIAGANSLQDMLSNLRKVPF